MIGQLAFFGLLVVGAVVWSVYNDIQNVDRVMWQKDHDVKLDIKKLEDKLHAMSERIEELENQLAEEESEDITEES